MSATVCPRCAGISPVVPRADLGPADYYCTPLKCDAWVYIARLTKDGRKPIRLDGRADLSVVAASPSAGSEDG